jgi:sialate O-acetylesterase
MTLKNGYLSKRLGKMRSIILFLCISICFVQSKNCLALETADIFRDGMVLQQKRFVRIWGSGAMEKTIQVKVSWAEKVYHAEADHNGEWSCSIWTPDASYKEHEIDVTDGAENIKIVSILVGEVWLCSGQSNMEMSFNGYPNQPIQNAQTALSEASNFPAVRIFQLAKKVHYKPTNRLSGSWVIGGRDDISKCSALGYFFGKMIHEKLDVPVGIIQAAWDGSSIEGWLTENEVSGYSDYQPLEMLNGNLQFKKPYIMFNGMIHPLRYYAFRGCLWYQGESNVERHATYLSKFRDMVGLWRATLQDSVLPFFSVEITPYAKHPSIESAKLREAQCKSSLTINDCYVISTNDLVPENERDVLHPSDKLTIAERLSNAALFHVYKDTGVCAMFARYASMQIEGRNVLLSFDELQDSLYVITDTLGVKKPINGFEVAGEDGEFFTATAMFEKDEDSGLATKIRVSSEHVLHPVSVRYGFKAYQPGNVKNGCGLPLIPFRTDNWTDR